jgi:hypothetical protein
MINIMPDKHFFRFQQCYRNIKSTHDQFHNAVQSEFLSKKYDFSVDYFRMCSITFGPFLQ